MHTLIQTKADILHCSYSKPVDMWAVGVVMFILLTGSKPFNVLVY